MVPEIDQDFSTPYSNGQICISSDKRNCLAQIVILLVNRRLGNFKKNEIFFTRR